jgi:integrase
LPASAERQRENTDDTKAVSRSRIDRLCRRRDVPLPEKTLWRMLYESASRASAVLALNIEDLDLPGHKSLRSVQRYVKPGLAAVHQATETLSVPRRRA